MIITAGIYKGRKIVILDDKIVRPTLSKIRESIFNTLFSIMDFKEKKFLDMFAGSGIMGLEALSRGFGYVLALEKSPKVAKILKENYKNIGLTSNLIIGDSLKKISKIKDKFDLIYLDPPYFSGIYEESLKKIRESSVLNADGIIILEHATEIKWQDSGFRLIKQKKYSNKLITFLSN